MKKGEILTILLVLTFSISLASANLAPKLGEIESTKILCEPNSLSLRIEATDPDGDQLQAEISPKGPFYSRIISTDSQKTIIEIYSPNITKEYADQVFEETIFITDGEFSDSKKIIIKTFETNNKPIIEPIRATTIALDSQPTIRKQISVTDIESGDESSNAFEFQLIPLSPNSNFSNLSITNNGLIEAIFNETDIGLHNIRVCVTDGGVENLTEKIGFCGSDKVKETTCSNFQLSIVETNTPPTILDSNTTIRGGQIAGTTPANFEIYTFDPDDIIPDVRWYVDGKLKKLEVGKSKSTFKYTFGCDFWGTHKIRVEITDGIATDTLEWKVNVGRINCEADEYAHEIIGDETCKKNYVCTDWDICQSVTLSEEVSFLDPSIISQIKSLCSGKGWGENYCGFQIRGCEDANKCNGNINDTYEIQECFFSRNPTCKDKIKNCHDSLCEFLTDCGGPCDPCPTCFDGIKNQGEKEADCEGPCEKICPEKIISSTEITLKKIIAIVALILLIIAGIISFLILRERQKLNEPSKHETLIENEK